MNISFLFMLPVKILFFLFFIIHFYTGRTRSNNGQLRRQKSSRGQFLLRSCSVSLVSHHLGCIECVQKGFASSIVVVEKFDFKDNEFEFTFTRRIQHFTKYVKIEKTGFCGVLRLYNDSNSINYVCNHLGGS